MGRVVPAGGDSREPNRSRGRVPFAGLLRGPASRPLQVAVACDEAFGGYFPDTLEALEARGARVCDFSPLRDDRLPPGTDVVYVGCGHPELFAEAGRQRLHDAVAKKSSMFRAAHLCRVRRSGLSVPPNGNARRHALADGRRIERHGPLSRHAHPAGSRGTDAAGRHLAGTVAAALARYLNPHWTIPRTRPPSVGRRKRARTRRHPPAPGDRQPDVYRLCRPGRSARPLLRAAPHCRPPIWRTSAAAAGANCSQTRSL